MPGRRQSNSLFQESDMECEKLTLNTKRTEAKMKEMRTALENNRHVLQTQVSVHGCSVQPWPEMNTVDGCLQLPPLGWP